MGLFCRLCGEYLTEYRGLQLKLKIGERLKRLRTDKGLTQKGLAAAVSGGLDYTYIGKIERGEQLPSLKILVKISEALSVPLGSFFPDEPIATICDGSTAEKDYRVRNEERNGLHEALELVHEDDIPLLTEIVKALARHRKAMDGTHVGKNKDSSH
jgi:transcriptional regulator with XRE-family HTH domain